MADYTLSSGSIAKPFRSPWGSHPIREFKVSSGVSSAAIVEGRFVTLDYTEAGNTSNAGYIKGSTANAFFYGVGFSAGTVSGSSAVNGVTGVSVWLANPNCEFSAVTKGGTLQSSHVGLTKTLQRDSSLDIAYVDLGASTATNHRVIITQLLGEQGDSGARVAFCFMQDNREQGSTVNSSSPYLAFSR